MARKLEFSASYDQLGPSCGEWWSAAGSQASIDLSGTLSRTGIGCVVLSGPNGPQQSVTPIRGTLTGYYLIDAYYQPQVQDSTSALKFIDIDPGGGGDITFLLQVGPNPNLGVTVRDATGSIVGVSAPNIITPNAYNVLEVLAFFVASGGGSCRIRVNGATVLTLTGLTTLIPDRSATGGECNNIQLSGPGGLGGARHDDTALFQMNSLDEFIGPVEVYAEVPVANGTPVNWTPKAGMNFSEVNQIPPPGDAAYVEASAVGTEDQYVYHTTSIPVGSTIHAIMHGLCAEVTAGAVVLSSDIGGIAATGQGLGALYHYTLTPYDINPVTGLPWVLADFPGTQAGPKITG